MRCLAMTKLLEAVFKTISRHSSAFPGKHAVLFLRLASLQGATAHKKITWLFGLSPIVDSQTDALLAQAIPAEVGNQLPGGNGFRAVNQPGGMGQNA